MTERERAELLNLRTRVLTQREEIKRLQGKIDALESKAHGYWKQRRDKNWSGGGFVFCSVCRYGFSYGGYANAVETFLYCPACGARMTNGGGNG